MTKNRDNLLEEINKSTYNFCKRILNLEAERSIRIFTFLINSSIWMVYFPALVKKIKEKFHSRDISDSLNLEKNLERICGLCLFIKLCYKSSNQFKKGYTDSEIDNLIVYDDNFKLIEDFFIHNLKPPNFPEKIYRELLRKIEYNPLPELGFDPEYQNLVQSSEASTHLILFTMMGLNISEYNYRYLKYIPKQELLNQYFGMFKNKQPEKIMNVNPELRISYQITEFTHNIGIPIFGSVDFIEDIITSFKKYYCLRVPARAMEIENTLKCFGELLKISQGKSYFEIQWNQLKNILIQASSKEISNRFLDQFCYSKKYELFPINFDAFSPEVWIRKYDQFLRAACFYHFGKVFSGVFLLWRALIKFFETIHREREFYTKKGKNLENWTFKIIESYKFELEKLILINKEKNPTQSKNYNSLKLQIKEFFKEPLELEVEFPDHIQFEKSNKTITASSSFFSEIDLAFRIENCLFMIECKGTSVPRSEEPNILLWVFNFYNEIKKLEFKVELLKYNIENGSIKHPFLKDIKHFIPLVVNTEGLSGYSGLLHTKALILYLGELNAYLNRGEFKEFLERRVYEFKDKSDKFHDYQFSLDDINKLGFEIMRFLAENPNLRKLIEENEKD